MMIDEKVIQAMKVLVEWRNLKDLCDDRSSCDGCPYNVYHTCDMISTDEMMRRVADVFVEYLYGKQDV